MTAKSERTGVKADLEDFDVSEEGLAKAKAERRARRWATAVVEIKNVSPSFRKLQLLTAIAPKRRAFYGH